MHFGGWWLAVGGWRLAVVGGRLLLAMVEEDGWAWAV